MGKGSSAVWRTILQIALATMLIIGGCNVFFGNLWTKATSSDELIQAVGLSMTGSCLPDVYAWVYNSVNQQIKTQIYPDSLDIMFKIFVN